MIFFFFFATILDLTNKTHENHCSIEDDYQKKKKNNENTHINILSLSLSLSHTHTDTDTHTVSW